MNDSKVKQLWLRYLVIWLFFPKFQVRYCNILPAFYMQPSPSLLLEVWKRSHHHHVHKISPLKLKSSSGHKCTDFRHWWVVLDCKRAKKFHKKQGGERRRSTKARGQRLGILMPDSLQSVLTMNALWTCISWYQRGVIKKCKHCLSQKSFKAVLIDFLTRNFA